MGRKNIEFPKENEGFCRSRGLDGNRGRAESKPKFQSSVWGGKSLKFLRKMKDFRAKESRSPMIVLHWKTLPTEKIY